MLRRNEKSCCNCHLEDAVRAYAPIGLFPGKRPKESPWETFDQKGSSAPTRLASPLEPCQGWVGSRFVFGDTGVFAWRTTSREMGEDERRRGGAFCRSASISSLTSSSFVSDGLFWRARQNGPEAARPPAPMGLAGQGLGAVLISLAWGRG